VYQLVADPLAATLDALGPQTALMSSRSTSPTGAQPSNIRLMSSPSGTSTPTAPTPTSPYGTYVPPTALTAPGTPAGALLSAQQNPYLGAFSTTKPVETVLQLTNKNPQDALHILGGISALVGGKLDAEGKAVGAWAEPYLNDVARLAWAREEVTNGRNSDPRNAPLDYIENWKDGYFGSDPNVPLVKEMNQQMIDYGVQKATQERRPFNWKDVYGQNGEAGLIVQQTTGIDCGPNAASTVLRSLGYNADPAQMFTYAKQRGYHNGNEFTGPANFARMLTEDGGVPARLHQFDPTKPEQSQQAWATVDAELDAGRVVVLSSPGHYWSISAKREGPRGTEYYGGATSTVAKNPAWGTKGQFNYGGNPNAIITTQGTADPNSRIVKSLNLQPPTPGAAAAPNPNNRALLSAMTTRQRAEHVLGQQARNDPAHQPQPVYPGETPQPSAGGLPPAQPQAPSPNMSATSGPTPQANRKPQFTGDEAVAMRQRIAAEMPKIQFDPQDTTVEARMRKMQPALDWLEQEYGISGEAIAGMAYNENQMGLENTGAVRGNNLWSVGYVSQDPLATGTIPEGRWAKYNSINDALARFVAMYAHPDNGYRNTWQNRGSSDTFLQGLVQDKYIVDEPGFPVSSWRAGVKTGVDRYRAATGKK